MPKDVFKKLSRELFLLILLLSRSYGNVIKDIYIYLCMAYSFAHGNVNNYIFQSHEPNWEATCTFMYFRQIHVL